MTHYKVVSPRLQAVGDITDKRLTIKNGNGSDKIELKFRTPEEFAGESIEYGQVGAVSKEVFTKANHAKVQFTFDHDAIANEELGRSVTIGLVAKSDLATFVAAPNPALIKLGVHPSAINGTKDETKPEYRTEIIENGEVVKTVGMATQFSIVKSDLDGEYYIKGDDRVLSQGKITDEDHVLGVALALDAKKEWSIAVRGISIQNPSKRAREEVKEDPKEETKSATLVKAEK